ncbi:MAG: hypothetical protein LBQ98_07945 [Nitrososphaerota archaeon]|jgi:hypothetical protein|nr:hypothetical protein [Nitrososphaerota archaeon]
MQQINQPIARRVDDVICAGIIVAKITNRVDVELLLLLFILMICIY